MAGFFVGRFSLTSNDACQQGLLVYTDGKELDILQDLISMGDERRSLRVLGECVCQQCYFAVHGVSQYAWKKAWTCFQTKSLPPEHVQRVGRPGVQRQICVDFVHKWIYDRSVSTSRDGRAHLPFWPRISWLYYDFTMFCTASQISPIPSAETFRDGANQELYKVSLPRGNADLKGCSTCTVNVLAYEKAVLCGDVAEAARRRLLQAEHELIAMAERHSYHDRRAYAHANPTLVHCFVQDWTHPFMFPILKQRTAERDHCQKFFVNYWVQINHSERHSHESQGVNFFWFVGGDGKDNGNVNASAIFYNIKEKERELASCVPSRSLPPRCDIQLDSGSGGKCSTTIGVLAFLMEAHGLFQDGIDCHFMISGHTGDDMDAVTAHVRSKCHAYGNWWSLDEVLAHFDKFYPRGRKPNVTLFNDFQPNDDHRETQFNKRFARHFLYDWTEFLKPYANKLSGISDKNVTRTEDSIHWWALRMSDGGRVTLQVARRSVGDFAILSDPVYVLNEKPRGSPQKIFFTDAKHALAGRVDLPAVLKLLMEEQKDLLPQTALIFYRGLLDEMSMCVFPAVGEAVAPKKQRKKVEKRVANLTAPPVLRATAPKGAALNDDDDDARDEAAQAQNEASDSEEEEESSNEELFRENAGDEDEYEVQDILDKEVKRGKVFYKVLYKTSNDEPPSWQPAENLVGAEEIVEEFEKERAAVLRSNRNKASKDIGRAIFNGRTEQLAASMGRTRAETRKK